MGAFQAAIAFHRSGDVASALRLFGSAIAADDHRGESHASTATLLAADRKFDVALVHANAAVQANPNDPGFLTTLGNILWRMERYIEARGPLTVAAHTGAPHWGVWHNLGLLEYAVGDYETALRHMGHALSLDPMNEAIHRDRAMALLASGQWAEGWEAFESRWTTLRKSPAWYCGAPLWDGSPEADHILVHHEQGMGDTLQFARWLIPLAEQHRVTFACPRSVWPLFDGLVDRLVDIDELPHGNFDGHAPLMSLPRLTGIANPDDAALPPHYLHAHGHAHFGADDVTRIGVVWAGSPGYDADLRRSMDVRNYLPLALIPGVKLYSLQVGDRSKDLAATGMGTLITDLSPRIKDWGDTAHAAAGLDAVISVDTSTLHLAAALGKPTLGLLSYLRCWRWSARWAPNLTVLRQPAPHAWEPLIASARDWIIDLDRPERPALAA